jgi:hypothetical protein
MMPIVVLVVSVSAIVVLGRVGRRSVTREFPMTWPATEALREPAARRRPAIVVVIAGLLVGLALGAVARIWMRLIAPEPEFTVGGTLGILAGFGLLFTGAGLSLAARRNGWRRIPLGVARSIGCILILPAFGAAGGLAFPSVVLGALAVARWDLRIPLRVFLALAAVAVTVLVAVTQIPDDDLPAVRTVVGIVLYPVLLWPMLLAARLSLIRTAPLASRSDRAHSRQSPASPTTNRSGSTPGSPH